MEYDLNFIAGMVGDCRREVTFLDDAMAAKRFPAGRASIACLTLAARQMRESGLFTQEQFIATATALWELFAAMDAGAGAAAEA